jgi:hypothetical protein
MIFEILGTLLAGAALLVLEVWILGTAMMFVGVLLSFIFAPLYAACPIDPDFAAGHPWRYHVAHIVFWGQKTACALAVLGTCLYIISVADTHWPNFAYWYLLYIEAVLLSLQFFPNDANSLVPASAISYRLRGKQSRVRGQPQVGTVGPVYLDPIHVTHRGW